jgi:glyoxylase-like metal-dependent hydrolase (beta-lactamase superfamily II)
MCGNHRDDGTPVDHHHHDLPIFMPEVRGPRRWRRRAFLGDFGKGTMAFAVLAPAFIAACSADENAAVPAPTTTAGVNRSKTSTTTTSTTTLEDPGTHDDRDDRDDRDPVTLSWARANLGFVSAYVLAQGAEVAIVDTGVEGSADDIGQTLAEIGLDYGNVTHVFLTHLHNDHAGSIMEVMGLAENATAYAGPEDIGGIDHAAGILVAGDTLNTAGGGVQGPNLAFSIDLDVANQSAKRLADPSFNTLLAGHGDPVEDMADTAVAALAATL